MGLYTKTHYALDSNLVDKAEQEIFEILFKQHMAFQNRWYSSPWLNKFLFILRTLGILLSILGVVLCLILVWNKPHWCPAWLQAWYGIPLFVLLGGVFYFFSSIEGFIKARGEKISRRNCRKLAGKCVKVARQLAPYEAEYEIRGDLITYYRRKGDTWNFAWARHLKGIAVHGECATVLFKRRTSLMPMIIILHKEFNWLEQVLSDLNIEVYSIAER